MNFIEDDIIDGSEEVKFIEPSLPSIEKKYNLKFDKGNKREIKTIAGYLARIEDELSIKQIGWNAFKVINSDDELIMYCELADDRYISEKFEETALETHKRLYKVTNISELISFLMHKCMNIKLYENEEDENFSLKEWLVEQKLLPYQILFRRIQQVVNYCKYKRIYDINLDDNLKSFITDYLQMILRQTIRNPSNFNYIIGLRIARYLSQNQFYNFNIALKQVTKMIKRGDKVTFDWMQKLLREYDLFEINMINYINLRINK